MGAALRRSASVLAGLHDALRLRCGRVAVELVPNQSSLGRSIRRTPLSLEGF